MWKWLSKIFRNGENEPLRLQLPHGHRWITDDTGQNQSVFDQSLFEGIEQLEIERLGTNSLLLSEFEADLTVDQNHFDKIPERVASAIRNCWWLPSSGHPNQSQFSHWQRPVKLHRRNLFVSGGYLNEDDARKDIELWLGRMVWQQTHPLHCQQMTSSQPLEDGFFSCVRLRTFETESNSDSALYWSDVGAINNTLDCLTEFVRDESERIGHHNCEQYLQGHYGTFDKDEEVHPVFQLIDYPHFDMGMVIMTFSGSVWSEHELRFWSRPTYFHK